MKIFLPKETLRTETRAPVVPATVARLVKLGADVEVESGLGESVQYPDEEYRAAGGTLVADRTSALAAADLVLRLRPLPTEEVASLRRGCIHISHLDPFNETALLEKLAVAGVSAIAMELIPRSTVAQKMDALSSQASLAGYVAVLLAADRSPHVFPMMTTPSGTIRPVRVFVIGAGVAGLQAIATAKRLGATVSAFDTRPVVAEQVRSLGAKFVQVDLGETAGTAQGYAVALTPEQLVRQRNAMATECAEADVVITTAQVFGRKAPVIVTTAMVERMRAGSVVVDLAIESGGNVECARLEEEVVWRGVNVLGFANLPGRVARTASQMYSNNLGNLVDHFWQEGSFRLDPHDPLLAACLVTHDGTVCHPSFRDLAPHPPLA